MASARIQDAGANLVVTEAFTTFTNRIRLCHTGGYPTKEAESVVPAGESALCSRPHRCLGSLSRHCPFPVLTTASLQLSSRGTPEKSLSCVTPALSTGFSDTRREAKHACRCKIERASAVFTKNGGQWECGEQKLEGK
ncbi:hypothetical protein MRX96_019350 [Rhipicephalus microplus]